MFIYGVRRLISRRGDVQTPSLSSYSIALSSILSVRHRSTATAAQSGHSDHVQTLLHLCTQRHYIASGQPNREAFQRGAGCGYGPLGVELRRNIVEQWWVSVARSRARVLGIGTAHTGQTGRMKVVDGEAVSRVLDQTELNKEQMVQKLQTILHSCSSARTSLLQGALERYVPSLELVNRKLPFGLAEAGLCFQPSDARPVEVLQASLVWFCSPRTSSQWLDYWARQRLQWWRKFSLGPSDFVLREVEVCEEARGGGVSRGVEVVFRFPWGAEPLETLLSRGDAELLLTNQGSRATLQCRDGRRWVVPHVLSVTGQMDRAVLAFLCNSLQEVNKAGSKQKLQQRQVLKLHPVLAPVKVALDMGKGATAELRQVCEGLLEEFLEAGISAWPGYLDNTPSTMDQLNTKYDEMGVLFSVLVGEHTLESGLVQLRSRDTSVRETVHVSELRGFLSRHVSASENT